MLMLNQRTGLQLENFNNNNKKNEKENHRQMIYSDESGSGLRIELMATAMTPLIRFIL